MKTIKLCMHSVTFEDYAESLTSTYRKSIITMSQILNCPQRAKRSRFLKNNWFFKWCICWSSNKVHVTSTAQ